MDFLRSIEEDLNLVEAETKKKLPAVKDAAEKGIEKIGQIRQLYAQMLRVEAAPGPGNAIFKCDAILRPFLLACNHATASQKLLIASFNSIQKLVSWDAITSEAVGNILRVLQIQAERNSHQDIQLKLLQTLLQLLTLAFNKGDEQMTNEDLISQAIWICLHLQSQSGNAITANTAVMTLRQVVTMVFDNITTDAKNLDGAKKVGFLVFQDLCLMSREEVGMWLKRTTFSKILGVELLEAVLTSHGSLFRCDVEFRSMLKQHATHLITSNLSPSTPFPLLLRIMRLASTVLSQFTALLQDECNTIWLGLVEIVSTGSYSPNKSSLTPFVPMQRRSHQHHDASPQLRSMHSLSSTSGSTPTPHVSHNNLSSSVNSVTWHVLLAMEVIYKALGDPDVLPALSSYPNHLLLVLARTVAAVVATSPPCDYRPGHVDASMPYRCGLEYLNEQDAPPLQPFYNVLRISLLCQYHVLTVLHANDRHLSPLRVQYILCSVAPFVMNALHCTMRFCREAELVTVALKGYHLLTNVNAHSRDRIPLDGRPIGVLAIQALCVFSFPVPPDMSTRVVKCISGNGAVVTIEGPDGGDGGASDGMANSDQQHHQQQQCVLTWKEMHAMKTLFRTIHTMEQELNEVEWRTLLEGFEVIVGLSALKQKTKGVNQRIGTGPSAVKVEDEDVEQQLVMLGQSILEYFTNTSALHPSSLLHILRAIRSICYDQISHLPPAAAPTSSSTVASQSSTDDAMLVEEELQQLLALWSPDQQTAWDVLSVPFGLHVKTFETTLGIGGGGNNNSNAAPFTPAFSLRMFVQLAKANVDAWTFVMDELVGFVCLSPTSSSSPLPFQMYATDAVFQLVQAALTTIPSLSQSTVTAYVLRAIQSDQMKERALVGLLDLLQTTGHLITQDAWPAILEALGTSAEADARCQVVAFKSLRLIVDDLVVGMQSPSRRACIACVGVYASCAKDVNISLTAVNELWTLADTIAKRKTTLTDDDDEVALWPTVFSELKQIALDTRPEVRNCAINTLFGTAVTHGAQFRLVEWTIFLQGTVLPLAHQLSAVVASDTKMSVADGDVPPLTPVVVLHHSRDSVAKQYDESRVLVLAGVSRVLQTNTASLLLHADWFVTVWKDLIGYIAASCTDPSSSKEVVLAGIQTLHTLLQIASTSSQDLSLAPLRAGVGMRVVNGVCTSTSDSLDMSAKKKPTLLSRDPQLWTQAFELLLRLAHDRATGDVPSAQDQDIAGAMVTVFVSIYLQSKDTELHDVVQLDRILHVFDQSMHRFVLTTQPNAPPLVVTTNSLHARILNSYDECGYFDEAVHVAIVRHVVGFVSAAAAAPTLVFVLRHALQCLAKMYEGVSPVAQAATFAEVLAVVRPFFNSKSKTNVVPASASATDRAAMTMWQHALKVLLALIGCGMPTVPQSGVAALLQVVECVLHPGDTLADDDVVALQLAVLDRLVRAMMLSRYEDAALASRFAALLQSNDDPRVASACIQHMTILSGPANPNRALRDVCRQQLNAVFVQAIATFLEGATSPGGIANSHRNRVVVLLTTWNRSPQSVLEVFSSLCQCITCDDAEVRGLVQRILIDSDVAAVCLPLLQLPHKDQHGFL
ncbi:hypothetical protein DYB38_000824 [Aphanomyces astaci]|uniref:Protein MON2 homolog n=1 Tax=Aphanomyces astaci TaxID=112090 RepID=A0A397C9Q8_APHAT|nr:hypothetical protein DYB38_000824 [Aphanomyces astaci]